MQLTLDIPENKLSFFMELIQNLGFVKIDKKAGSINGLTEHQKELVNIERKKAKENPGYMQDWDDVLQRLDPDAC